MPSITIELTDAEAFALDTIALDKQEWARNFITERARIATENLKGTTEWVTAAIAVGSADDDAAILLKGKELNLFKTAAERQADFQATNPLI